MDLPLHPALFKKTIHTLARQCLGFHDSPDTCTREALLELHRILDNTEPIGDAGTLLEQAEQKIFAFIIQQDTTHDRSKHLFSFRIVQLMEQFFRANVATDEMQALLELHTAIDGNVSITSCDELRTSACEKLLRMLLTDEHFLYHITGYEGNVRLSLDHTHFVTMDEGGGEIDVLLSLNAPLIDEWSEREKLNICYVVSISSSMEEAGLMDEVLEGIRSTLMVLDSNDYMSIVVFNRVARVILPPYRVGILRDEDFNDNNDQGGSEMDNEFSRTNTFTSHSTFLTNHPHIEAILSEIRSAPSSNLCEGLEQGFVTVSGNTKDGPLSAEYRRVIVLISDGSITEGIRDQNLIGAIVRRHCCVDPSISVSSPENTLPISISTVKVGQLGQTEDDLMRTIASRGCGEYFWAPLLSDITPLMIEATLGWKERMTRLLSVSYIPVQELPIFVPSIEPKLHCELTDVWGQNLRQTKISSHELITRLKSKTNLQSDRKLWIDGIEQNDLDLADISSAKDETIHMKSVETADLVSGEERRYLFSIAATSLNTPDQSRESDVSSLPSPNKEGKHIPFTSLPSSDQNMCLGGLLISFAYPDSPQLESVFIPVNWNVKNETMAKLQEYGPAFLAPLDETSGTPEEIRKRNEQRQTILQTWAERERRIKMEQLRLKNDEDDIQDWMGQKKRWILGDPPQTLLQSYPTTSPDTLLPTLTTQDIQEEPSIDVVGQQDKELTEEFWITDPLIQSMTKNGNPMQVVVETFGNTAPRRPTSRQSEERLKATTLLQHTLIAFRQIITLFIANPRSPLPLSLLSSLQSSLNAFASPRLILSTLISHRLQNFEFTWLIANGVINDDGEAFKESKSDPKESPKEAATQQVDANSVMEECKSIGWVIDSAKNHQRASKAFPTYDPTTRYDQIEDRTDRRNVKEERDEDFDDNEDGLAAPRKSAGTLQAVPQFSWRNEGGYRNASPPVDPQSPPRGSQRSLNQPQQNTTEVEGLNQALSIFIQSFTPTEMYMLEIHRSYNTTMMLDAIAMHIYRFLSATSEILLTPAALRARDERRRDGNRRGKRERRHIKKAQDYWVDDQDEEDREEREEAIMVLSPSFSTTQKEKEKEREKERQNIMQKLNLLLSSISFLFYSSSLGPTSYLMEHRTHSLENIAVINPVPVSARHREHELYKERKRLQEIKEWKEKELREKERKAKESKKAELKKTQQPTSWIQSLLKSTGLVRGNSDDSKKAKKDDEKKDKERRRREEEEKREEDRTRRRDQGGYMKLDAPHSSFALHGDTDDEGNSSELEIDSDGWMRVKKKGPAIVEDNPHQTPLLAPKPKRPYSPSRKIPIGSMQPLNPKSQATNLSGFDGS
ncbi:hypothetical protein BLNAU_574 [Blattamonas nauphoetae]|uniref:VWFA domain-containing protein n=1 Tax=Blattamonas nauphoetae TaxID=2049346 RepID=A0ABQ9YLM9_9EUKA|nr:hypothetical protein BLNAU_574 [Blattamonas nauphoetae]